MSITFKTGIDRNGNKTLAVKVFGHRSFTIQTNGNLPETHRKGVCLSTLAETLDYVMRYGTESQKRAILSA